MFRCFEFIKLNKMAVMAVIDFEREIWFRFVDILFRKVRVRQGRIAQVQKWRG
jgi:hypothetical protein